MSGGASLNIEQVGLLREGSQEFIGYVRRATRAVEKGRMLSNAMNANSDRIHSCSEKLDSSTAITLQTHRAREEPSKLRGADYVERNDHAKRDGEVPEGAFNASRSIKVMGVNLRVQYEYSMRCDKPSAQTRSSNSGQSQERAQAEIGRS